MDKQKLRDLIERYRGLVPMLAGPAGDVARALVAIAEQLEEQDRRLADVEKSLRELAIEHKLLEDRVEENEEGGR